jgi:hypothetical protein
MKGIEGPGKIEDYSNPHEGGFEGEGQVRIGPLRERLPMLFPENERVIFAQEVFEDNGISVEEIDRLDEDAVRELIPLMANYFDDTTEAERKVKANKIVERITNYNK